MCFWGVFGDLAILNCSGLLESLADNTSFVEEVECWFAAVPGDMEGGEKSGGKCGLSEGGIGCPLNPVVLPYGGKGILKLVGILLLSLLCVSKVPLVSSNDSGRT